MSFEPKKDAVRRVGFLISYEWFNTEAASTTFVLKHQDEVSRSLSNLHGNLTDFEIREGWRKIKNNYEAIPEDMIKPWDLASSLIR